RERARQPAAKPSAAGFGHTQRRPMKASKTALLTALVAVGVVVADQISKAIVRSQISRFEEHELFLGIKLINTRNTGVAFSMFSGGGPLVVIIAFIALGALLAFFLTHLH